MILELLILGIVVGANNLATSLALGVFVEPGRRWRIVAVFAFFEFTVPLVGMWLGQQVAGAVTKYTSWLAPALIGAVGAWTILAVVRRDVDEKAFAERVATGGGLAVLAATLSLDNLVVGFGLGLGERNPLLIATTIAMFSAGFAWSGLYAGRLARRAWRRPAELASGLLLLGLAAATALGWI